LRKIDKEKIVKLFRIIDNFDVEFHDSKFIFFEQEMKISAITLERFANGVIL